MFVYIISHLKGMEYDINRQIESLDKTELDQHKVARILKILNLPELDSFRKKDRKDITLSESIISFFGSAKETQETNLQALWVIKILNN